VSVPIGLLLAQLLAMTFVLLVAPLHRGILERFKARLMYRVGPPVLQPYRDLRKWFQKERLRTRYTTWVSQVAPYVYFSAPLLVASLIPVLTAFPLPFAFNADMLGGGMILAAGGFALLLAAMDAGSAVSLLGVSRVRLVSAFTEPLSYLAVFTALTAAHTTVPFVVNQTLSGRAWAWSPAHLLVALAWFLLLLAETGRIPVDNPASAQELSLIDPARVFDAAGPDLALYEWGGWMKSFVLTLVLANVLLTPWGLAHSLGPVALGLSMVAVLAKALAVGALVVLVEVSFAKLRLLRIGEFVLAAALLAFLGGLSAALGVG
jgi:formate hydrogenlyase subunit 4